MSRFGETSEVIKHRRQRVEPVIEHRIILGETHVPARCLFMERTSGWLTKRRSIRVLVQEITELVDGHSVCLRSYSNEFRNLHIATKLLKDVETYELYLAHQKSQKPLGAG